MAPVRMEVRTDMAHFFSSADELRITSTMKAINKYDEDD